MFGRFPCYTPRLAAALLGGSRCITWTITWLSNSIKRFLILRRRIRPPLEPKTAATPPGGSRECAPQNFGMAGLEKLGQSLYPGRDPSAAFRTDAPYRYAKKAGGYVLTREPASITVLDIMVVRIEKVIDGGRIRALATYADRRQGEHEEGRKNAS